MNHSDPWLNQWLSTWSGHGPGAAVVVGVFVIVLIVKMHRRIYSAPLRNERRSDRFKSIRW